MRKEVLDEFDQLMEHAVKISQMRVLRDNTEWLAFVSKRGEEVRCVSSVRHLEWLPHVPFLYLFFKSHKIFWLIPCCTPNDLAYGYVLRSFSGKEYRVVSEPKAGQLLFGWESFDGGFSFGVPIILVEGAKDAIFAQMVHPYSLAFLSSDLTKDTLNYLCKITDRFILAVDSDASGDKHRKNLHRELGLRKCRVADIIPQGKDLGEYFRNKEYNMRVFRQQLSMAFKKVEYNDSI